MAIFSSVIQRLPFVVRADLAFAFAVGALVASLMWTVAVLPFVRQASVAQAKLHSIVEELQSGRAEVQLAQKEVRELSQRLRGLDHSLVSSRKPDKLQ